MRRYAVALILLLLPACAVNGLAFEQDNRLRFTEPEYREKVTFPFTIEWSIEDFDLIGEAAGSSPEGGYIEVLFDKDPQPPGEDLEYFARDDETCLRVDACPNRRYLAVRQIYLTTEEYFTVRHLPPAPGVQLERGEPDRHDVVLVLVDGNGKRIGESAWWNSFEIVHDD